MSSNAAPGGTDERPVLVVDASGDAPYEEIQAAIDAAQDGDVVTVRPGTYRETLTIRVNITLLAPNGATLNGDWNDSGRAAIEIEESSDATVDGFTLTNYPVGIDVGGTTESWTIQNTTMTQIGFIGIRAPYSTGNWTVRNTSIVDTDRAIDVSASASSWRVIDTEIRDVRVGIDAPPNGSWRVENVTITGAAFYGIGASYTNGDWVVRNTTIRRATIGIGALEATGNWTVWGSQILNITPSDQYDFLQPPLTEGVGIYAHGTNGSWRVHATRFDNTTEPGIIATDADPSGNATYNSWRSIGDSDTPRCTGTVDCSRSLEQWPPAPDAVPAFDDNPPTNHAPTTQQPSTTESTPTLGVTTTPPIPSESHTLPIPDHPTLTAVLLALLLTIGAITGIRYRQS